MILGVELLWIADVETGIYNMLFAILPCFSGLFYLTD